MMMRIAVVATAVFLVMAGSAGAGIYYWIDENGVKHFSSDPPPAGVPVIERSEEIPHDEREAMRFRQEQEQTWQELQRMWDEQRRRQEAAAAAERQRREAEQRRLEAEKARREQQRLEKEAIREKRYETGTYEQKRRRRERAAEQQSP